MKSFQIYLLTTKKIELDNPITKLELDEALTNMKNNKFPGLDGYSAEFFFKFWPQLGHFFLECIKECFENDCLIDSMSQGLITCLPKSGKARNLLKNWRPISLLNTTYKLISSVLTTRELSVQSKRDFRKVGAFPTVLD